MKRSKDARQARFASPAPHLPYSHDGLGWAPPGNPSPDSQQHTCYPIRLGPTMDPLSLSASCVGLIAAVTKTSLTVTSFVREVRDARRDLDAISRELSSLKNVLELLAEDTDGQKGTLPTSLESQITGMLTNCNGVVTEIENGLAKASKSKFGKAGYWTLGGGQSDMAKLRSSLEAYKSALEISLDMVTM